MNRKGSGLPVHLRSFLWVFTEHGKKFRKRAIFLALLNGCLCIKRFTNRKKKLKGAFSDFNRKTDQRTRKKNMSRNFFYKIECFFLVNKMFARTIFLKQHNLLINGCIIQYKAKMTKYQTFFPILCPVGSQKYHHFPILWVVLTHCQNLDDDKSKPGEDRWIFTSQTAK